MNPAYVKMGISMIIPAIATMLFYFLDKKTPFSKLQRHVKQFIIGVVFGGLALICLDCRIIHGVLWIDCRNAVVLSAGLLFGAPSGLIAGVIAGVGGYFSDMFGNGYSSFSPIASMLGAIFAGAYAAVMRKYMFDDKKPRWMLSFAIAVVMEVVCIVMIIVGRMYYASEIIIQRRMTMIVMLLINSATVVLCEITAFILAKEKLFPKRDNVRISDTIQRRLFATVSVAFIATTLFVYFFQNEVAKQQSEDLLRTALQDVSNDIRDSSDANLLRITHTIANLVDKEDLDKLAELYNIAEISVVNSDGIIVRSTEPQYLGYDMSTGSQSAEFLCLLYTKPEFVQEYGKISVNEDVSRKYAGVRTEDGGFVQVGYDADQFHKDIATQVVGKAQNRHVGENGYVFIWDRNFNLVSAPTVRTYEIEQLDKTAFMEKAEGENFSVTSCTGESFLCSYQMEEGYYIVALLSAKEEFQTRDAAIVVNTIMEVIIFAALFSIIYLLINRVVVNRIKAVNSSLAKITGGDLEEVVNVRSNEEFASLSDDINSTVSTLKHYIAEASARIDEELVFAKNIQASALPSNFPAFPQRKEFDIYASMYPAREVGGDFYDFYLTENDKLNFLVADVSGKGIPAAMFMMRAKTELKSLTENGVSLSEVFTHGNMALCEGNDAGMFVTAWQGSLDLDSGVVRFANAGHNPPLVRHQNGQFEYIRKRAGFVLAGMEGVQYVEQELRLLPGDIIYLYTDGVTEATNANEELYGEERLLNFVNSREFADMQELCQAVRKDVDLFVDGAPQFDDITMVAVKYNGKPPVPTIHIDEATLDDIPVVTEFVETELEKLACPPKAVIQIDVAIDEIFSNIVNHGYKGKPGPITVKVIDRTERHMVCVRFSDEAAPYNPLTKEDPDVTLSLEERGIGGLGIYMVKQTMDNVKYKYENGQNVLTIFKSI